MRDSAAAKVGKPNPQPTTSKPEASSSPLNPTFLLTPSFHSAKSSHRFCMFFPASAHTKYISLRTVPTSPRSQAFSLQETAPCRRTTPSPPPPSQCRAYHRSKCQGPARPVPKENKYPPPLLPELICSFPQNACMFSRGKCSLFFAFCTDHWVMRLRRCISIVLLVSRDADNIALRGATMKLCSSF